MAAMLNAGAGARGLSTITTRAILNSIATRLDEGRELSRYLVGLLVFLGLLGTFWGLLETVHSISGVIESMKTGVDTRDDVRRPQDRPLGPDRRHERVVHLLAVRPRELADPRLSRPPGGAGAEPLLFRIRGVPGEPRRRRPRPSSPAEPTAAVQPQIEHQRNAAAIATLAEGIQALVGHMRTEQQQIRNWVDVQAQQQEDIGKLLRRLLDELTTR